MKEDDIMVTRQDLNRIIVEKVKQNNHDMRETTVVIQGGEIIQKDGKATTKKPNKPFRNSYSAKFTAAQNKEAKNDFVAAGLRVVMKDYFSSKHTTFEHNGALIVRKSEHDYAIKVSKLKFSVEAKEQATANPTTNQVISLINSLDGLYVVGNDNNSITVSTYACQQYVIRITKKKDRVSQAQ